MHLIIFIIGNMSQSKEEFSNVMLDGVQHLLITKNYVLTEYDLAQRHF